MKKIINGVEYETFAPNKNSKKLGIDTSRKFIMVDVNSSFKTGDILELKRDDDSDSPYFNSSDVENRPCRWDRLAYYDEPKKYKFRVGDKVRITGNSVNQCLDEGCRVGDVNIIKEIHKESHHKVGIAWFKVEDLELVEKASGVILEEVEPILETFSNSTYSNIFSGVSNFTQEQFSKCIEQFNEEVNLNKQNKFMSIITNAFKSKENKALEHFNLGTTDKLNEQGRNEFTDFIYETGTTDKKEFFKRIVKAHEEDNK